MQLTRPLLFRILVTTKSSLLFLLFHALPSTRSTDRRWKMVSKATTELTVFDKLLSDLVLNVNRRWMYFEWSINYYSKDVFIFYARMSRKLLQSVGKWILYVRIINSSNESSLNIFCVQIKLVNWRKRENKWKF